MPYSAEKIQNIEKNHELAIEVAKKIPIKQFEMNHGKLDFENITLTIFNENKDLVLLTYPITTQKALCVYHNAKEVSFTAIVIDITSSVEHSQLFSGTVSVYGLGGILIGRPTLKVNKLSLKILLIIHLKMRELLENVMIVLTKNIKK